jgi:tRNA-dihydrouridine synthase A
VLGLFQAVPGARLYRRLLAEHAHKEGAGLDVWRAALAQVKPASVRTAA